MAFIVTGGAGFIGSHLVDRLIDEGENVRIIDDLSSGSIEYISKHRKNKSMTFFKENICGNLRQAFNGKDIDGVFHLAAKSLVRFTQKHPKVSYRINVLGTVNMLEWCRKKDVPKFIFSSSSAVYGNANTAVFNEAQALHPESPYAIQKSIAEKKISEYAKLYGLKAVALRYFNVYGPRQNEKGDYANVIPRFINQAIQGKLLTIYGKGTHRRDYIFVSDVIKATVMAKNAKLPNSFSVLNIGSGKSYSVNFLARKISELCKKPYKTIHTVQQREPQHTCADISITKHMLKWKPKIPFFIGLSKTVEYYYDNL